MNISSKESYIQMSIFTQVLCIRLSVSQKICLQSYSQSREVRDGCHNGAKWWA